MSSSLVTLSFCTQNDGGIEDTLQGDWLRPFFSRKSCLASAQVLLEDFENNDVGITDQQKLFLDTEKCLKEFLIKRLNVSALQSVHRQSV